MNDIVQRHPWFREPIQTASCFNHYKKQPAKSQAGKTTFTPTLPYHRPKKKNI
jgi:hypothetical protein